MILFYILSVLWAAACITTLLLGCIVLIMFSEYGRENLDYKTGLIAVKWFFLPPVAVIKIVNMRLEHHDAKVRNKDRIAFVLWVRHKILRTLRAGDRVGREHFGEHARHKMRGGIIMAYVLVCDLCGRQIFGNNCRRFRVKEFVTNRYFVPPTKQWIEIVCHDECVQKLLQRNDFIVKVGDDNAD